MTGPTSHGVGEGRGVAADGEISDHVYSAAVTEHLTRDVVPSGAITEGHEILV